MALKMSRTGVRADQVNVNGLPIASDFFNKLVNDLPTWTDLLSYVGGTEQLLPVNDDEPDTSPILCDIQYQDALRNDQYFTYRESPTTKDGLAKIRGIRGNTLVWNQRCDPATYFSTLFRATKTISGNTVTVTDNRTTANASFGGATPVGTIPTGHKVFVSFNLKSYSITDFSHLHLYGRSSGGIIASNLIQITSKGVQQLLLTVSKYDMTAIAFNANTTTALTGTTDNFVIENLMVLDLTQMFGSGNEPTIEEFKSLFPLSYYAYNSGSLLNFNGTGIKTTGKNLMNADDVQVGKAWNNGSNSARATTFISVQPNTQYTLSYQSLNGLEQVFATQINSIGSSTVGNLSFSNNKSVFTTASDCYYIAVQGNKTNITKADYVGCNFQLELGSSVTSYEPYTSSTLSLPISTYFPTGMKNAGSVYDELTPTKAITRIGAVDLGSLDWLYNSSQARFYVGILEMKNNAKLKCAMYETVEWNDGNGSNMGMYCSTSSPIVSFWNSSYTDPDVFKSAMSGVYLFYELATPVVEATMSFE